MRKARFQYRRNSALNVIFLLLIGVSFVVAMFLAHRLTEKYVENEFETRKIDVLEETLKPYNEFFQNRVPEISFYQGYLDSSSAIKYVDTVFRKYPFVKKVEFYDTEVSNHRQAGAFRINHFSMLPRAVYDYRRGTPNSSINFSRRSANSLASGGSLDEFKNIAAKFALYVQSMEGNKPLQSADFISIFYHVTHNRITFMNIPREEDMLTYRDLMLKDQEESPVFQQDIVSFILDPEKLHVRNTHRELYQYIHITPIVYESLNTDPDLLNTELPLTGAFADYKLHFSSSRNHIIREIYHRLVPVALAIVIIYTVLLFIAYLIYRNLNINRKMYSLQYDFINNLTHEFKTPVSVIKIAGNNIKSAKELSDRERHHYGKILDEEADKLNDLMNKLLSFTQIENQSIHIKKERINIPVFIQNMVDAYFIKLPDFNISYETGTVSTFRADPVLLSSIFQNLMDNAYKYSLPGKKTLNILVYTEKGNIVFKFRDEGIGIPAAETENVFKKFYRIQSQYNQQGSVGLGLAFCKELINLMNGTITLRSKVGEGSEFTVVLPFEL
ncbi:MAG: sensor histidine kinase [Arcticibacter sp.]